MKDLNTRLYMAGVDFQNAYEAALRILARDERELKEYTAKPDHNAKAAAIRDERLQALLLFVEVTRETLALQGQHIAAAQGLEYELKTTRAELEKLRSYARSKGMITELLPYMHLNEFRRAGL